MIPIQGISTSKEVGRYQLLYVKGNVIHLRLIPDDRHVKYDLKTGLFLPSSSSVVFYYEEGFDHDIYYADDMPSSETSEKYKYHKLISQIVPNVCSALCIALVNKQDEPYVEKIMREMLPKEDVIVDQHKSDGSYRLNICHKVPEHFHEAGEILVKGQETMSYEKDISLEQLISKAVEASQQHKDYSIKRG